MCSALRRSPLLPVRLIRNPKRLMGPAQWVQGSFWSAGGSTHMRSTQLRELIRPHLSEDMSVEVDFLDPADPASFRRWAKRQGPGIYVLGKHIAREITPEQVDTLRSRGGIVGADHVDGNLAKVNLELFDFHIGASLAAMNALRRLVPEHRAYVGYLPHHPDPRLSSASFSPLSHFNAAYVGNPLNIVLPEDLKPRVRMFKLARESHMNRVLPHLPNYNFHYCVRPPHAESLRRSYKPFTKGFTAAMCQSNVLVGAATDDAVHFLGQDYPFLVHSMEEREIVRTFEYAESMVGSPEWHTGLDRMKALLAEVAPARLAMYFERIVRDVSA